MKKPSQPLEAMILTMRGHKVILDADLARVYGVETKALNQAVKRNADRFPEDFVFQLTAQEVEDLRCQIGTSNLKSQIVTSSAEPADAQHDAVNRSQIVTGSYGGRRYLPWAFTEHGAIMAATVLHSPQAVEMSVFVVRAFVRMREQIAANAAILKRLAEIDKTLLEHDQALRVLWAKLQPLLAPTPPPEPPPRPQIGFHVKERRATYGAARA